MTDQSQQNGTSEKEANARQPSPIEEPAAKRQRVQEPTSSEPLADQTATTQTGATTQNGTVEKVDDRDNRNKGYAPIKKEYLIDVSDLRAEAQDAKADDDAAEGRRGGDDRDGDGGKHGKKKKAKGQNTERSFGKFDDALPLCNSRAFYPEFSPRECRFGDRCRMCHDVRKYLAEGRRGDVETFEGKCPVFAKYGRCPSGWKCRFVRSHMDEVEREDGRKELVLLDNSKKDGDATEDADADDSRPGVVNVVPMSIKIDMNRKRLDFSDAEKYIAWLDGESKSNNKNHQRRKAEAGGDDAAAAAAAEAAAAENRARFVDPPFLPSEKRRLYFGPETPTLAPLTTQGNLPFRRLCVELGCELTYSEMALGMPLLQGVKADWTLMKAHESELAPPRYEGTVPLYDNSRDLRFGAQISGSAHWVTTKAASALARFCPHLRLIDLNCGCPIDMVYKTGGGSALLEAHGKLERMVRGMNAVSGEVPFGSREHRDRLGAPGCAAVTLHGRSREQRYTKLADWGYIAECAALVRSYNEQRDALTDTAAEPDARTQAAAGRMFFLGNGDCYSHVDYQRHVEEARVDAVMVGRGALVKPWLFEEIAAGQYLDKSASERLAYVEKFARYGLEAWGSDELGLGFTRRFLLEWLSFAHRYVPIGLLERLPPSINERPPAYRGRNELETLLASPNYKDWIKISEMFLGPCHPGFQFMPKHKSNAYEAEG
ncbi:tRNA-dihydrouridine synthase 3 [Cordyceps fumosorosea ARSEF 2679]|uniref:tRNA-dihydrouridine(47) synthase [NAD(P)(+)] n=1 Tax=Cordyceps fumosorosea (strain ARSEF 2679) TaxID=1081104 RepID=A0A167UFD7_CORFA|nr:tRNA-dihydrouridine synthase 3 [Cordyceps fumosorosea ARSEF 2679]OAA61531.1 tRNA-dihydrouridine synthase 3 [Cordyceps fumosorosea ARSEF 2679]